MNDKVTKLPAQPNRLAVAFDLGDKSVDAVVVKPLSFQGFVDVITEANLLSPGKAFDARMRRIRMIKQVSYFNGTSMIPFTVEDVLKIPIPAARVIVAKLDDDDAKPGKIVRDGDGIDQAITFELGTPIPLGQGKQPIRELEFLAKTYGDIEDVLAADNTIQQSAKLIETIGKPLGTSLSLLPSWALTQVTIADGLAISREVLPRFLGSAGE